MPTVQGLREKFLNYRAMVLSPRRLLEPVFMKKLGSFFAALPGSLPPQRELSFAEYHALSFILQHSQGDELLSSRDAEFLNDMRQAVFGEQPLRVISVLQLFKTQFENPDLIWPALQGRPVGDMLIMFDICTLLPRRMLTHTTISSLRLWRSNLPVLYDSLFALMQADVLWEVTLTIIDNPNRDVQTAAILLLEYPKKFLLYPAVLRAIKQVTLNTSQQQKKYCEGLMQMMDWMQNNPVLREQLFLILSDSKCDLMSVIKVLAIFCFTPKFASLGFAIKTLSQTSNRLRDAHLKDLLNALYFLKKHQCLKVEIVELLVKHPYDSSRLALAGVFLHENQLLIQPCLALLPIGGGRFAKQWAEIMVAINDCGYLDPKLLQHFAGMQNLALLLPKVLKIANTKNLAALTPIATRAVVALEVEWAVYLLAANISLERLKHPGIIALMQCLNPAGLLTPANAELFLKLYDCEPGKCELMMRLAQEGALFQVDFTAIAQGVLQKAQVEQRLDEIESLNNTQFSLSSVS